MMPPFEPPADLPHAVDGCTCACHRTPGVLHCVPCCGIARHGREGMMNFNDASAALERCLTGIVDPGTVRLVYLPPVFEGSPLGQCGYYGALAHVAGVERGCLWRVTPRLDGSGMPTLDEVVAAVAVAVDTWTAVPRDWATLLAGTGRVL